MLTPVTASRAIDFPNAPLLAGGDTSGRQALFTNATAVRVHGRGEPLFSTAQARDGVAQVPIIPIRRDELKFVV